MDAEEARTIGWRVRQIRKSRGKSQEVIAGRAGISTPYLSQLERGKRPLSRLSLIVALADALEIAPSELTKIPTPAPGNGHTDSTTEKVRRALTAVDLGRPGGLVLPTSVLRDRVSKLQQARRQCRFADVATGLPDLIRDLHTSIDAGQEVAELLPLAVILHVDVTRLWLRDAGAPQDLRSHAAMRARTLAAEHGRDTTLAVAAFGAITTLLAGGMVDLAQAELDSIRHPATTVHTAGLLGALTMAHSVLAAAGSPVHDVETPLAEAAELAERFGELGDEPLGFGFGPTNVDIERMTLALETDEPDRAASIAAGVHPERHPHLTRQATYWVDYARALSQLPRRREEAVAALLTAEEIFPHRVYRNPIARDTIVELAQRSRKNSVGRELRGMAYRAGLTV